MNIAEPKVTLLAQTQFSVSADGQSWSAWTTDASTSAEALAEFAGRACYQSWSNPSGRNNREYIANILAQEHFSVLEHAGFTVYIEGVSRSLTHELVRHRHFSFSQLSQRFYNEDDHEIVVPPLFEGDEEALAILREVDEHITQAYKRLAELGYQKLEGLRDRTLRRKRAREAARCVLPNMTETKIAVSGNHRSWREFFEKRGSIHADAEIRRLAIKIFTEVARPLAPAIYQDFELVEEVNDLGEKHVVLRRR